MPPTYQQIAGLDGVVRDIRIVGGGAFPIAPGNRDYEQYLRDVAEGATVLTPPAAPIVYAGTERIERYAQTNDTAPAELLRLPLTTLTAYGADVEVFGIDAGNGVVKSLVFRSVFKRLNGGALAVGARVDLASHQDSGAAATTAGVASWAIVPSLVANDAIITVTGAAGRTVDWFAFATVRRFRPGGV